MSVDLAKFVSDINKDVSASVDYDAAGKKATVNVGYKSGDASVKLKTSYDVDGQSASHKVNAGYTVEGIDAVPGSNDKLNGEVTLAKDGFTLTVPFADKKVNQSDITLQKRGLSTSPKRLDARFGRALARIRWTKSRTKKARSKLGCAVYFGERTTSSGARINPGYIPCVAPEAANCCPDALRVL